MSSSPSRTVVVIGGGIIGCTTAYYLSRLSGYDITLLEASKNGVAQGASGKAGGLVAKWAYPKELVQISFKEHVVLAKEHDGASRWGWRYVNCGSWEGRGENIEAVRESGASGKELKRKSLEKTLGLVDGGANKNISARQKKTGLPDDLTWVSESLTDSYSPMAGEGDTAQVYPYEFTSSMMDLAKQNGVKFVAGKAARIVVDEHGTGSGRIVTAVEYQETSTGMKITVPASHVILAAGAWSPTLLSEVALPISATRAHSITLQPQGGVTISPYVLFTEIKLPHSPGKNGTEASPEIYARPNDEVYACGPGDDSALPETVDDVVADDKACTSIQQHVASISAELREANVNKRQACFLPTVSTGGGPIVGEANGIAKGLIIATGHTCWGICNAPGTAKAIADIVEYGEVRCGNLKKLQPSIFI